MVYSLFGIGFFNHRGNFHMSNYAKEERLTGGNVSSVYRS
ncbi:phosphotransferase, partial [Bacillus cereus]